MIEKKIVSLEESIRRKENGKRFTEAIAKVNKIFEEQNNSLRKRSKPPADKTKNKDWYSTEGALKSNKEDNDD